MIQRVTLPINTINILSQFGDISIVVNKILDLVEQNVISVSNLPSANTTHCKCKKITLTITNQYYISAYDAGNKISLVRLLQYFVDNELYAEFDWDIKDNVDDAKLNVILDLLHVQSVLVRLCAHRKYYDILRPVLTQVEAATKEIENECI